MLPFEKSLKKEGYEVRVFSYPLIPREKNISSEFIREANDFSPHYIVGHSFGGTMSVHNVRHFPSVEKIVCLGSPLRGSHFGTAFTRSHLFSMIPESMRLIASNGVRIPRRATLKIGSIAGTDGRLSVLKFVSGISSLGVLKRLTCAAHPKADKQNDGIVFVSETRAGSAAFHTEVFANHTQLIFSKEVQAQTIHFLREGCFIKK